MCIRRRARLRQRSAAPARVPGPSAAVGRNADGESLNLHAIQVSQSQLVRAFELRAALGLAQIRAETGRVDSAVELLDPLCASFPNAARSVDLTAARDFLQCHRAWPDAGALSIDFIATLPTASLYLQ